MTTSRFGKRDVAVISTRTARQWAALARDKGNFEAARAWDKAADQGWDDDPRAWLERKKAGEFD